MAFWRLYYHFIWTTKHRAALITPGFEEQLRSDLIRQAASLDVQTYAVNSLADHVHMVVAIPPRYSVGEVIKFIKEASAEEVNQTYPLEYTFAWHAGYGALTLGEKQKLIAVRYVENQQEHHRLETTNRWLEHTSDDDGGPTDAGLTPPLAPRMIGEHIAAYHIDDDFPF